MGVNGFCDTKVRYPVVAVPFERDVLPLRLAARAWEAILSPRVADSVGFRMRKNLSIRSGIQESM